MPTCHVGICKSSTREIEYRGEDTDGGSGRKQLDHFNLEWCQTQTRMRPLHWLPVMSTSLHSLINDSGLQIHVFLLKHSINESVPSFTNRHSCISGIFNHVPRGPIIGEGPNLIMSPWSQGTSLRWYQTVTLSKRPVGLPATAITSACVHSLIWLALRFKAQNTSDPCCGATFKKFGFYSEDEAVSWSQ